MIQVCPERDAECPHGYPCPHAIDRYQCRAEGLRSRTPDLDPPAKVEGEGSSGADSAVHGTVARGPREAGVWLERAACPHCRCTTFAKVDEPTLDGGWDNTKTVRCVDCKRTYAAPNTPPSSLRSDGEG